jgi:hypothetical protein
MQYVMLTVAFLAARSMRIVQLDGLSVDADVILPHGFFMTGSAIHGREIFGMREIFAGGSGMTVDAIHQGVHRSAQGVHVNEHGYRSAIPLGGQFGIFMAHHAILVRLGI